MRDTPVSLAGPLDPRIARAEEFLEERAVRGELGWSGEWIPAPGGGFVKQWIKLRGPVIHLPSRELDARQATKGGR